MKQQIIVSGIQPSNKLTLGNYLGAIKPWILLQKKYKMFIFVADLHCITSDFDPFLLSKNKKEIVAFYAAAGLDFNENIIFYQSDVLEHNNLAHVLLCHTTLGELNRMTQFKDKTTKSSNNTNFIRTGLLTYPTLMAADILLYDADVVAVGSDQKQHIELTRDIAQRMNNKYGNIFVIPQFFVEKNSAKIMDLLNPDIKMSKSNKNENGTIFLLDEPEIIRAKIMKSKTDSLNAINYDEKNQPGISNLINIYCSIKNISTTEAIDLFKNIKNYGEFKKVIADELINTLIPIQTKFKENMQNFSVLSKKLDENAIICKELANRKLINVYKKIGLKE